MKSTIIINQVSKRYKVGKGLTSIKEIFSIANLSPSSKYHWAVKDVSFTLQAGESLGIIGPNGAGKTTILKLLSKVTYPTTGSITTNGRLSSLIELGAGFHPDLTGRDNIYLNGTLLGMRRTEINARFDQIVEFAGIGKYLDTPVKRYSSGMYARLGFAIAAHINPVILLVDEVLAVGDYPFRMKCYARMEELQREGTTIIFVSHNMEAVRTVCDSGLVLYQGKSIYQGDAADAIVEYSNAIREASRINQRDIPDEGGLTQRFMTFDAEIESAKLYNKNGDAVNTLISGEPATVIVSVVFHKPVNQPIFSFTVRTPDGRLIYDTTTLWKKLDTPNFQAGERCRVEFDFITNLLDGEYQFGVDVTSQDQRHYYDRLESAMGFWVKGPDGAQGIVDMDTKISVLLVENNC